MMVIIVCSTIPSARIFGGKWLQGPMFKVYMSQCLSTWGDRMWWFAAGIFMKDLGGGEHDSLLLTGVFTFALSGAVVTCGSSVGRWLDRTPRLKAARKALLAQNLLLALCALTISFMFYNWENIHHKWNGWLLIILQSVSIITASLSRLASVATTIVLQKDWIIILSNGDLDHLARINSIFRAIDLTSQVLAPIVVGVVQDLTSNLTSAIMIGCWNVVSVFFEYTLLWLIYKDNPRLAEKLPRKVHTVNCIAKYNDDHDVCPEARYSTRCIFLQNQYHRYFYAWVLYFKHPIRAAGIGLALLYMTVLGFDAITTAYGNTQVTTTVMGVSQGLAAVFGVLGTISFPPMRKYLGLKRTGMVGLMCEVVTLTACVYSIWLPGSPFDITTVNPNWTPPSTNATTSMDIPERRTENVASVASIAALLGGIIVSRFGLWMTDITITQIFQEGIEENKRGVINGVQDAMNMGMDMVKSILVILFPYPPQFGLLILLSFLFVCAGFMSYTLYYYNSHCQPELKEEKTSVVERNERLGDTTPG